MTKNNNTTSKKIKFLLSVFKVSIPVNWPFSCLAGQAVTTYQEVVFMYRLADKFFSS